MSYPPRRDSFDHSAGQSSADMYAAVPTNHETMSHSYSNPYDDALSTPPIHSDSEYPIRSRMTPGGDDSDPYARYDHQGSTYSLGGADGSSQLGLHTRPTSNLGAYDNKYEDHEMSDKAGGRRGAGVGGAAGGRTLARGGKDGFWARLSSRGRKFVIIAGVLLLIIIAIAVAIPAAIVTRNNNKEQASSAGSSSSSSSAAPKTTPAPSGVPTGATGSQNWRTAAVGGDGSTVYTEDGSSFIYNNTFGGYWVSIPYNDTARAQEDVPPLNEPWNYNTNLINGVNIGGWLTIEPFIVPGLFEPFNSNSNNPNETNGAIDEWTLSQALGSNLTSVITNHYATFITEQDFAEIAGAGLNWVRIPIPWWIIEVWDDEPFLANVGWTYFLKAITWARKYGIRINLDFHAVPGSQNGYNHSGKQGTINLLNGVMGVANAQRTLSYVRTLTEFISQPEYSNVIPMFSVLNEPYGETIGSDALRHYYLETYNMMREITGLGEGKGPFITYHDGFLTLNTTDNGGWLGWQPGSDRVGLDRHPYLCFDAPNNDGLSYQAAKPCSYWASDMNQTTKDFGLSIGGEWSLAINDCGKWLNNVGNGNRYDGTYYIPGNTTAPRFAGVGSCDPWNDYKNWNQTIRDGLKLVATGHMDAFRHWFFWTWKTGFSSTIGDIANPMWNYQLGVRGGWIPSNPRIVVGACQSLVSQNGFTVTMPNNPAPTLSAWMTGGAGAGTILNTALSQNYTQWPPASLGTTPVANLPTYTPTAPIITMPSPPTPTSYPAGYSATPSVGDGWFASADKAGQMTKVAGCSYPNPWSGVQATIPAAACTGSSREKKMVKRAPEPVAAAGITPAPKAGRRRLQ